MTEQPPKKDTGFTTWEFLQLSFSLGYTIAIPALLGGLGGRYVDGVLGTKPLCTVIGLALAILVSTFAVVMKAKRLLKDLERNP